MVLAESASLGRDVVEAVSQFGSAILDRIPHSLPHVKRPTWRMLGAGKATQVRIRAGQYYEQNGTLLGPLGSGSIVLKHRHIRFKAVNATGLPFLGPDYKVHWRVVNTGNEAANAGGLRGEFNPSEPDGSRWERTLYRGAHWVEAFVIRTRDGACVGQSERFFVVIE